MTQQQIQIEYTAERKCAVLTFANGRKMKLSNVTEEQAKRFVDQHGQEFARRDCILHTEPGLAVRSDANG